MSKETEVTAESIWFKPGHRKMFGRIVRALDDGRVKIEGEVPMSADAAVVFLTAMAEQQKSEIAKEIHRIGDEMTATKKTVAA